MNIVLAICQLSITMAWCVVEKDYSVNYRSTIKCVFLSVMKTHGISNHNPGVSSVCVRSALFILQWLHQLKKIKIKNSIDQLFFFFVKLLLVWDLTKPSEIWPWITNSTSKKGLRETSFSNMICNLVIITFIYICKKFKCFF